MSLRPRRILVPLLLGLGVAWGAWIRVETALRDPNFDAVDPRGMLRSDPALLYYVTERIVESGGGAPDDFRADPRVQHPEATDIPAEFALGQEFLVAWAQLAAGSESPLHLTALRVTALTAAFFVVGVFGAVRAVTRSDPWAGLAALLALATPANYRTIGFLLVREDLALPLFALHLALAARALRTRRALDSLTAGLVLAAALATWHAAGFIVLLELTVVWILFLRKGRWLEVRAATAVLFFPALAGLVVPALRASGWLFSHAAALAFGLWVAALAGRLSGPRSGDAAGGPGRTHGPPRGAGGRWTRALGVGASALWFLGTRPFASSAHAHVHQVLWAKLRFLGRLPEDPGALSFDARLLWQGPFETLAPAELLAWIGWPVALLLAAAVPIAAWRKVALGDFGSLALGLTLLSLPVAWLFGRLAVLVGMLAPIAIAIALARLPRPRLALGALAAAALVQLASFSGFVAEHRTIWYLPPPARADLAALLGWIEEHVAPDQAIAADFVNSPAILAHTRRPIVLQPKYETDASRRRAEAFLTTLFQGTPSELASLVRQRFRCEHVLFDRHVLWDLSRYTAGLRADERVPRPGTAAEAFLGSEGLATDVEGFELLYRSPAPTRWSDFRLYRLR